MASDDFLNSSARNTINRYDARIAERTMREAVENVVSGAIGYWAGSEIVEIVYDLAVDGESTHIPASTMSEFHPYDWAVIGPHLGVWRTVLGSASLLMADTLTITADGTGSLDLRSAFRGNESVGLVWRHLSPGVMQIVPLYYGIVNYINKVLYSEKQKGHPRRDGLDGRE